MNPILSLWTLSSAPCCVQHGHNPNNLRHIFQYYLTVTVASWTPCAEAQLTPAASAHRIQACLSIIETIPLLSGHWHIAEWKMQSVCLVLQTANRKQRVLQPLCASAPLYRHSLFDLIGLAKFHFTAMRFKLEALIYSRFKPEEIQIEVITQ